LKAKKDYRKKSGRFENEPKNSLKVLIIQCEKRNEKGQASKFSGKFHRREKTFDFPTFEAPVPDNFIQLTAGS